MATFHSRVAKLGQITRQQSSDSGLFKCKWKGFYTFTSAHTAQRFVRSTPPTAFTTQPALFTSFSNQATDQISIMQPCYTCSSRESPQRISQLCLQDASLMCASRKVAAADLFWEKMTLIQQINGTKINTLLLYMTAVLPAGLNMIDQGCSEQFPLQLSFLLFSWLIK